jgi:5-methylcytosine-specific restriction endonuclease McrA
MSVTYIGAELRRRVVARAEGICEYCLIAEDDTFYGCEADHIISEKHGGPTDAENLALACVSCNQSKGSDVGSSTGKLKNTCGSTIRGRTAVPITSSWWEVASKA